MTKSGRLLAALLLATQLSEVAALSYALRTAAPPTACRSTLPHRTLRCSVSDDTAHMPGAADAQGASLSETRPVPVADRGRLLAGLARARRLLRSCVHTACVLLLAVLTAVPAPLVMAPALAAAPPTAIETGLPSWASMPSNDMIGTAATPKPGRRKTSFVTAAVDTVGPAVVKIDTERFVDRAPLEGYLFPGLEPDGQRKESGQGSGVILNQEGLIMTNAHVVKNAAKVTVTLTVTVRI